MYRCSLVLFGHSSGGNHSLENVIFNIVCIVTLTHATDAYSDDALCVLVRNVNFICAPRPYKILIVA